MLHHGKEVRSQTDYIHGTDHSLFQNMTVQDPRHNTGLCMVMGCLRGASLRGYQCYLGLLMRLPLYPPKHPYYEDTLFASLRQVVPKTPVSESAHASWI